MTSGIFLPGATPLQEGNLPAGASRQDLLQRGMAMFAGPQRGALTAEELGLATRAANAYADQVFELLQQLEREQAQQATAEAPQPAEQITQPQQAMRLGDPIPWVVARRRNGRGGVLHFPPATEARFETSPSGIRSYYHCVLGAGQMGQVQAWQVRVGDCRRGEFSQAYGRRTGSWDPGNAATAQTTFTVPEFPVQCGGGGDYTGLSTIEFSETHPPDADRWKRAWNVFVTEGCQTQRILDNITGPTDNIVDVWLAWRRQNGRVPDALIDFSSLTKSAKFLEEYGLLCNAVFSTTTDLVRDVLPWFLLRETRISGKYGLTPLVRCDDDGIVADGPINPDWVLTGDEVVSSLALESVGDATKLDQPIIVMWRQQETEKDVPIMRTLYATSTGNGLKESEGQPSLNTIDLSAWCDNELHAARVGCWYHSKALRQRHIGTIKLRPGQQSGEIIRGHVVQVKITTTTEQFGEDEYSEFFTVENTSYGPDGSEQLTVSHLPVDEAGRAIPDMAFLGAQAPGMILPHPPMGGCDLPGREDDTSVPPGQINSSQVPFSQGGAATFVPPGTSSGSGGPGNADVAESEPPDVGGYTPQNFPPSNTGGKRPRGQGKPGRKMFDSDGGEWTMCAGGIATYEWKISEWQPGGSQVGPETYPGEIFPVRTIFTRSTIALERTYDGSQASPPTHDIWKMYYTDINGMYVDGAIAFAWPMDVESVKVTCSGGGNVNTKKQVVVDGDNLYNIAGRKLGDPDRWPEIFNLNRKIIDNPNLIFPGQALDLPAS